MTKKYDSTLYQYLQRPRMISLEERFHLLKIVADTIKHLHDIKIYHYDIKASNIFIGVNSGSKWNGELVIGDFGIGKQSGSSSRRGTPGFSPPEQFTSQAFREGDIYALGKLSILIVFEWEVAWKIISNPLQPDWALTSELLFTNGRNELFRIFHSLITTMLKVN